MNYYNPTSNYYYPYNNSNNGINQYPYNFMQQQQQQPSIPTIYGKIVDGEEVVKATEIPMGGYGVFPKADFSEVYLKTWNNNGTTSIIKFKPVPPTEAEDTNLIQRVNKLEEKVNTLLHNNEDKTNGF